MHVCVHVKSIPEKSHIGFCLPNSSLITTWGVAAVERDNCAQQHPPLSSCVMAPPCSQSYSRHVAQQTYHKTEFCFPLTYNHFICNLCRWGIMFIHINLLMRCQSFVISVEENEVTVTWKYYTAVWKVKVADM